MKKNNTLLIASITCLIGLDMISKYFFYNIKYLQEIAIFEPIFNTGISRSLPVPYTIIILISLVGIVTFIRLFITKRINRLIASLLISGTIGNLIDRIFL